MENSCCIFIFILIILRNKNYIWKCLFYWHFLEILWIFIFLVFYNLYSFSFKTHIFSLWILFFLSSFYYLQYLVKKLSRRIIFPFYNLMSQEKRDSRNEEIGKDMWIPRMKKMPTKWILVNSWRHKHSRPKGAIQEIQEEKSLVYRCFYVTGTHFFNFLTLHKSLDGHDR